MNNKQSTVIINNTELLVKDYSNQRVITFKDIDLVHERPSGTARKRFNDNKKHFIEGEDFLKITPSEFRTAFGIAMDSRQQNDITLITESGYLMLVKSFTDDLAWKVQRQLVNTYFKSKNMHKTRPTVDDCREAASILASCGSLQLPYVTAVLRQGGFDIPDAGTKQPAGQKPFESRTNPDLRQKKQHSEAIVPGFGTDVLCAYAGQLRNMGENRNGWIILPNNDFKDFCASRAIPANPFRKWLYENGYILGHTENKSKATKYTFVYRFNGEHTRALKFSDSLCTNAERRPL